jgi:hypothetical protein
MYNNPVTKDSSRLLIISKYPVIRLLSVSVRIKSQIYYVSILYLVIYIYSNL